MPGAMQNVETKFAQLNALAIVEIAIGCHWTCVGDTEARAGFDKRIQQKLISPVRPLDRHAKRVA